MLQFCGNGDDYALFCRSGLERNLEYWESYDLKLFEVLMGLCFRKENKCLPAWVRSSISRVAFTKLLAKIKSKSPNRLVPTKNTLILWKEHDISGMIYDKERHKGLWNTVSIMTVMSLFGNKSNDWQYQPLWFLILWTKRFCDRLSDMKAQHTYPKRQMSKTLSKLSNLAKFIELQGRDGKGIGLSEIGPGRPSSLLGSKES